MSKTFKVGDRVKVTCPYFNNGETGTVSMARTYTVHVIIDGYPYSKPYYYHGFGFHELELIENEEKPMKTWGEMTREEKGELLLAHHEGKTIQLLSCYGKWIDLNSKPMWFDDCEYRVKSEPVVTLDEVYYHPVHGFSNRSDYPYKLTITRVNGVVDCNSVKMEEL